MHFARRMAFGEIERGEIEIVGLDIGPFGNREAHIRKDRGDLVNGLGNRVNAATRRGGGLERQCDVHGFGCQPGFQRSCLQFGAARLDQSGNFPLKAIDGRTGGLALFGRHRTKRRKQGRYGTLLAQRRNTHIVERRFVIRAGYGGGQFAAQGIDLGFQGHLCSRIRTDLRAVLDQNKTPCASPSGRRKAQFLTSAKLVGFRR